jgi:hypothetical protein
MNLETLSIDDLATLRDKVVSTLADNRGHAFPRAREATRGLMVQKDYRRHIAGHRLSTRFTRLVARQRAYPLSSRNARTADKKVEMFG